jgi:hypothetical protein
MKSLLVFVVRIGWFALMLGTAFWSCSSVPTTSMSPMPSVAGFQKTVQPKTPARVSAGDRLTDDEDVTWPHDGTEVRITHTPEPRTNLVCTEFCDRLATCWYAKPGADPALSKNDVVRLCLGEENNCERPQNDRHCCGWLVDCHDFNTCVEKSRNVPSDCALDPGWKPDEPVTFTPLRR